jgi:hypothetical protein
MLYIELMRTFRTSQRMTASFSLSLAEVHSISGLQKTTSVHYEFQNFTYTIAMFPHAKSLNKKWRFMCLRTSKHEIECYLHTDAIQDAFAVTVPVTDNPDGLPIQTPSNWQALIRRQWVSMELWRNPPQRNI